MGSRGPPPPPAPPDTHTRGLCVHVSAGYACSLYADINIRKKLLNLSVKHNRYSLSYALLVQLIEKASCVRLKILIIFHDRAITQRDVFCVVKYKQYTCFSVLSFFLFLIPF
jgi:hypothetical protein